MAVAALIGYTQYMEKNSDNTLVPYSRLWPDEFELEKKTLLDVFPKKILGIEHVGSTSIPGLLSKPIVDIAVMVQNYEPVENFLVELQKIGYHAEPSSTERHYFTKGTPIKYHLSIAFSEQGGFWVRQILFRDYLRTHDLARDEYAALKQQLMQNDVTGRNSYLLGKTTIVYKILDAAGWKKDQNYQAYKRERANIL